MFRLIIVMLSSSRVLIYAQITTALLTISMRDLGVKNAPDAENIELAKKSPGHTTTNMTDKYIRARKGEFIKPYK